MSAAAQITTTVVNDNANRLLCTALRDNIRAVVEGPQFTLAERTKANINASKCQDVSKLQTWHRNLHKERQKREAAHGYGYTYQPEPEEDEATGIQRWYDECDQDIAA